MPVAAANRVKRRFKRRTLRVLVDFAAPDRAARFDYATTLGAGGLFIQTDEPLERGTKLLARFRLAADAPLHEIASRVVWSVPAGTDRMRPPGMGIEFTDAAASASLARELERLD